MKFTHDLKKSYGLIKLTIFPVFLEFLELESESKMLNMSTECK